ncbi:CTAGE family, member 5-like protein [Camelus ferus]|nr:CTAGE family, member 5-like protein [Camelus ferus]
MEVLLPAPGPTFQLILELLSGALLLVYESLTHVPGLSVFHWEILVCAGVLVLAVNRWYALRRGKLLGKTSSARDEVCEKDKETPGPMTQAYKALKPPGPEASPPLLQILCFWALKENLRKTLLQGTVDFIEKAQKSQPPQLSQVTDGKHTLKPSEKNGKQAHKKEEKDLNKNTGFPESPELFHPETGRQKQQVQGKEELGGRLEQPKAGKAQVLQDRISRLRSTADHLLKTTPSPDLLGGPADGGHADVQQRKEAENGHRPVHGSEGDLKGVTGDADYNVPLPCPQEEHQGTTRCLWEEKQAIQKLTAQITSLQIEEASVKCENAQLDGEIEQLKLKLQSLPDAYDDCVMQLYREFSQVEARCLEVEKKLTSVRRDLDSTCQMRDLCKKMAQDAGEELERTTSYHLKEIHFQEKRAEESWLAAAATERKLQELRKESDRNRQMLAQVESSVQPVPRGPGAPAAPPAAPRGPGRVRGAMGHQAPWEGGG